MVADASTSVLERFLPGPVCVAVAAALFSVQSAIIKHAIATGLPSLMVVSIRCTIVSVLMICFNLARGKSIRSRPENEGILLMHGVARCFVVAFNFTAIGMLSLPVFVTIAFTYPVMATVLAYLVLGEVFGRLELCACICSLVGVLILSQPSFIFGADPNIAPPSPVGVGVCFIGTSFLAVSTVLNRMIGRRESSTLTLIYFNAITAVVAFGAGAVVQGLIVPTLEHLELMGLMSCISIIGQVLLFRGIAICPPAKVLPLTYLEVFWSTVIGVAFFRDAVNVWEAAGMSLILGSAASYAGEQYRRSLLAPAKAAAAYAAAAAAVREDLKKAKQAGLSKSVQLADVVVSGTDADLAGGLATIDEGSAEEEEEEEEADLSVEEGRRLLPA